MGCESAGGLEAKVTQERDRAAVLSRYIVLRPLDDLPKVSATPTNKIAWVTSKKYIFRG